MADRLHADELLVDDALVRALVDRTLPAVSGRPLRRLARTGSDNALYRLGDDLLVRLPRQPGGGRRIAKESRWLPSLAGHLPVRVPEVVAVGEPGFGYPERWSIVRWLEGVPLTAAAAAALPGAQRAQLTRDLAELVLALCALPISDEAARDPALRWYRAGPLPAIDVDTRRNIDRCRELGIDLDLDAAAHLWKEAVTLPQPAAALHWLHADLLAENLLLRDGRLVALLDFGGLAVGDPTVDLVCVWELLNAAGRNVFRELVPVSDETWLRGRGWALALALMTFPYYGKTMPQRCADRLAMARAAITDR